jgi:predicted MFS family arabinose efflux permease
MPPDHQIPPPLRRNSAFQWLLGGSTLSMLGSRLTTIAYPLLVLAWHGSPVMAGLTVCAANAPSVLLYVPAGALVDRSADPRRTMIFAETVRGLAIAVIILALLLDWKHIPFVIAMAIVEESFEVFATLAELRYVRTLVRPDQASDAQVGMEARSHVVVLAGRALGGLLFGWAQCLPFIADFLTFWISVLSVTGTRRGDKQAASSTGAASPNLQAKRPKLRDLLGEVRVGWRELAGDDFVRTAFMLSAGMTLVSQALIIVFLEAAHSRHVSSFVIGSVLAASGIGGLVGTLISRWNLQPWNRSPLGFQPFVWAVMLLVLAFSGRLQIPVMAFVMTVLGLVGAMGNVELGTYLMRKVPDAKVARVNSIEMVLDFAASAVGPALGGLLTELWGTGTSILVLFAASTLIALPAIGLKVPVIATPIRSMAAGEAPPSINPRSDSVLSSSHDDGHPIRQPALG